MALDLLGPLHDRKPRTIPASNTSTHPNPQSGVLTVSCFFFLRETYAPILLSRKAALLRKETSNPALRSKLDTGLTPKQIFRRAIVRPTVLLTRSPIVFGLSLLMAITYGYLYLLLTTFTYVFEDQYGFSSGSAGLTFLGIGVGSFVGLFAVGFASDRTIRRGRPRAAESSPRTVCSS